MTHTRETDGLLAAAEKRLLIAIAARLPRWLSSDHLTLLGLLSMLVRRRRLRAHRTPRGGAPRRLRSRCSPTGSATAWMARSPAFGSSSGRATASTSTT